LRVLCLLAIWISVAGSARGASPEAALEQATRALGERDAQGALIALEPLAESAEVLSLRARALLLLDRPQQALDPLYRLEELRPDWPELDFMLGLAHYRLSQWDLAEGHLVRAAEQEPDQGRIWLLLGVAQDHLGNHLGASEALERARELDPTLEHGSAYRLGLLAARDRDLDRARHLLRRSANPAAPEPVRRSAGRHLQALQALSPRASDAWLSAGVAHDTNVNLAGDEGLLALLGGSRLAKQSDARAELDLGVERLALSRGPLGLRVGYRGSLDLHRHERRLDAATNFGWLRASYAASERLGVDLGYGLEWGMIDFDAFRRVHVIEPALRAFLRSDLLSRLYYRHELRGFFEDAALRTQDRDGVVDVIGWEQIWLAPDPFGLGRNFVRAGLSWREEDAEGAEFDARGPAVDAELGIALPAALELTLGGRLEHRRFDRASSFLLAVGDRSDRIVEWRFGIARALGQHFWLSSGFRSVHWASNVPLFDYDRRVVDLRLIYRY
jgi:Flp pilus assembly protein TadD